MYYFSDKATISVSIEMSCEISFEMTECEYKAAVAHRRTLYRGGPVLATCFGKILRQSVDVIQSYQVATKTATLKKETAFLLLDTLFYDSDNQTKRGFTLTLENIAFIKDYVRYVINGRLGWHVDEYIQELSTPAV